MGLHSRNTTGRLDIYPHSGGDFRDVDNLWGTARSVLSPVFCASCRTPGHFICKGCQAKIHQSLLEDFPTCLVCENLSIDGATHRTCKESTFISRFRFTYRYSGAIRSIMSRKSKNIGAIELLLATQQVLSALESLEKIDVIVPIPSSPKPLNPRLTEPNSIITRTVGRLLEKPITQVLYKNFLSKPQKSLAPTDRWASELNIDPEKNSIIAGKNILLVDDICTTGASLSAAAKVLISHGARLVSAYSLARDLRYNKA